MHAIWFQATQKTSLWEFIQAQQLHYTRFRMLDFVTETDFTRIVKEHADLLARMEANDQQGLEEVLKRHLYISMTRMKDVIESEYKNYFEEEG